MLGDPASPDANRSIQARNMKKKNTEFCGKFFLRSVLLVFNVIFWLSALTFLAVGVYIIVQRHTHISLLGSSTFPITTYILVAVGIIILIVGCLGCVGVMVENSYLLVTYSSLLLVIFLLEAIAGVLAYMYEGTIREELTRNLNSTMMEYYKYDDHITQAVDHMQEEFKCCGSAIYKDWKYSRWLKTDTETKNLAPDSCCKTPSPACAERDHPSNIDYIGCSKRLEQYIRDSLILIGGIGLGLCCVQLFGIIFSCCLVRKIKESKFRY